MNVEAYRLALDGTGRHKMRALSLLAEGTSESRFEAAVMLHDAARAEQRALRSLERVPPEVALTAAVERCWCLMEGLDPPAAANAYGEVLRASERIPVEQVKAMRARLDPKFAAMRAAYAKALPSAPAIRFLRPDALDVLLQRFPGVGKWWFLKGTAAKTAKSAWQCVGRATKLEPEDSRFRAGLLQRVGQNLFGAELRTFLDASYESLSAASADVCLFHAIAEIEYAQTSKDEKTASLKRAREACIEGESKSASIASTENGLRPALHAVRLLVDEALAGRKPDPRILYAAGLGEIAISAQDRGDIVALSRNVAATVAA